MIFTMSTSTPSSRNASSYPSPATTPNMTSEGFSTSRRSRPGQVQTIMTPPPHTHLNSVPPSAHSNSSATSSSQHESPTLSAEMVGGGTGTTGSSIQPSPEPMRGRDLEQFPPPLQLPDAVISRRTSSNSLGQSTVPSPGITIPEPARSTPGIMRRLSNKVVSGLGSSGRRQSSVHPISRDGSVGPSVIRNRLRSNSNSSALAPPESTFFTDSDDDFLNEKDDSMSLSGADGAVTRDYSPLSTTASASGSVTPSALSAGPAISPPLKGSPFLKLSKRGSPKPIILVLDADAAKIYWDKNRPSKCVYLDDIKEIRIEEDLRQYEQDYSVPNDYMALGFSLIVAVPDKSKNRMIHLVAPDKNTAQSWMSTIEAISKHRQEYATSLMAFNDKAIRTYWQSEMSKLFGDRPHLEADELIDFPGVERVCWNLHIHVSQGILLEKFNRAARSMRDGEKDDYSRLNFQGFMKFVQAMKARRDILPIYRQFASDTELGLTREDFFRFLRESQGENVDEDVQSWDAVFLRFWRKGKVTSGDNGMEEVLRMSEAGFTHFLTSTTNMPTSKEPRVYPVMDRPMNEYFISSSHNTYLLGRQVAGISSIEGYISALNRGCRCVEVDVWDGNDGEPIVSHGRTMTTQISFKEVIRTIDRWAFVKTNFPLWLSLEVRCSIPTQEKMAIIMSETFGSKLVTEPLAPTSDRLPSPSQLQGRILIKVKRPQPSEEPRNVDTIGRRRGNSFTSPLQRPVAIDNNSLPGSPLLSPLGGVSRKGSSKINTITEGRVHDAPSNSPSECDSDSERDSTKKTTNKISAALGRLGVYSAGIHFDGFDAADAKTFNHIFSFKEKTFAKNSQPGEKKRCLFRHNMRYMMRVYPNGTRISSTNFNPLIYWKRGVQMAALNWQTWDTGMQLNQAMFGSGPDQCGYCLKPLGFREIQLMPNGPGQWATKRERKNISLSVDVISAQQLMRPFNLPEKRTVDPYVEFEVFLADDKSSKYDSNGNSTQGPLKYRTKIVRGNGFNPEFDDRFNLSFTTKYPDLVFLRWTVKLADKGYNDRSPALATFTVKLTSLKQGYRTLPLLDHNGDRYLFSTLFCRVKADVTNVFVPAPGEDAESANRGFRITRPFNLNRSNLSPKSSLDGGGQ